MPESTWLRRTIIAGLISLALGPGLVGLLVAGRTMADVDTLKQNEASDRKAVAAQSAKMSKLAERIASVETAVQINTEQVKAARAEAQEQTNRLDDKLTRILERLPAN